MLTITEKVLLTIKNSNKMLMTSTPELKNPIENETFYKKEIMKLKVLLKFS